MLMRRPNAAWLAPWFCLWAGVVYNAVCWLVTAAAYYPATHAVRTMVEDDNFAQTWYVFWILPLMFIAAQPLYGSDAIRRRSIPAVCFRVTSF